jgi:Rrf2 family nitric oxide-sensitive transcriptional repressor
MQLSTYSDYSLRVLMLAALRGPELTTVDEVAETFGISRHHLVKIVHDLGRSGYLKTHRGIGGGFKLARAADSIRLGDVVRLGEETDQMVDCNDKADRQCRLFPACRLKDALEEAAAAFFAVLDAYTLADLTRKPSRLCAALGI